MPPDSERRVPQEPSSPTGRAGIVRVGANCWRRERAARARALIDGAEYFPALRAALTRARSQVFFLAWDIDSRLELDRSGPDDGLPTALGELLFALVRRSPELEIFVLEWDFAMIFANEREASPLFRKSPWREHPRLHFRLDDRHPVGASHHQKVVVIDDVVAFAGGMDPSRWRWDTADHELCDPRRRDPSGEPYPPHHDVQLAVEGDVAGALGDLARERWRRATGEEVARTAPPAGQSAWPASLEADFAGTAVAIARTEPAFEERAEVGECEALTLDAVRAAERWIYLESQYLSSRSVTRALAARLAEDDAPEVVLVLPFKRTGWLEEYTLGLLRSRCLRELRAADRHGRLGVYYPHVPGLDEQTMNVHSKVVVVDDRFLRIGSSNLCNRSQGLDTECDLAIEAESREDEAGIRAVLTRLLADQLARPRARVAEELERTKGVRPTIESLRVEGGRCLAPLDGLIDEDLERALPASAWLDPERPAEFERVVDEVVGVEGRAPAGRRLVAIAAWLAAFAILALLWRFSPFGRWVDPEAVASWLRSETSGPWGAVVAVLGFVLAAILAIPVSLLVAATSLAFSAPAAFAIAWTASIVSAWLSYELGRALGRDLVRGLSGSWINRLSRRLAKRGLLTVVTLRIVPVAPFVVVNMVMGASHIARRDFLLGTAIGMLPGVLALALFVEQLVGALRSGDPLSYLITTIVALLLIGAIYILRRYLARRAGEGSS